MEQQPERENLIQKTARRSRFLNYVAAAILVMALVIVVIKHF